MSLIKDSQVLQAIQIHDEIGLTQDEIASLAESSLGDDVLARYFEVYPISAATIVSKLVTEGQQAIFIEEYVRAVKEGRKRGLKPLNPTGKSRLTVSASEAT